MKTIIKSICMLVILFTASAASAQKAKTVQKVVLKTSIACNHCKQCPSCGGLLEKTLLKNIGIQMITLNEKDATIEVVFNSKKTDLPTIKTAISKLGYDADEVKADPSSYEKLDRCCKA